jgi:hypothetical protein
MRADPGYRTLGELLQEQQWAVDEISGSKMKSADSLAVA